MNEQKRYDVSCQCGYDFQLAKSLMHEMGVLDAGHATCPECETFLNIEFFPNEEKMVARPWEEYIEQKQQGGHQQ